ncbi:MAG TPA: hypothetical protein VFJ27_04700 [Terriglobia bacterium]|jgi:hypothetical protein|nr:hypothetical protein [Terriglobia bacterium]
MPKCKSCGKHVGWFQMLKNPLMLRNWKVLNSYLFETLCLECVASWNTYFEWIRKYQGSSRKSE